MKKHLILAATLTCAALGAQAQERTVRGVLGMGLTGGGDTLATVVYTDGSTDNIKSGGLLHVFGGAEFRLGPQATMQATIGYHVDETNGNSDGSLRFSRYPLELLAHYHVTPAFKLGDMVDDPLAMYLVDLYTVAANLSGIPAISIPCGMSTGGLPLALQLQAPPLEELRLLRAAHMFQQATNWHTLRPAFD